jgi:uncharacterized protein (TIGR02611 family)
MARRGALGRLRERLILDRLRPLLSARERPLAWAHVRRPEDGRDGLVVLTAARCVVHWSGEEPPGRVVAWQELTSWEVQGDRRGGLVLRFDTPTGAVGIRLPANSRARVRRAAALMQSVAELAPPQPGRRARPPDGSDLRLLVQRRGVRGHVRRALVTVLGLAVILVGVLFASPFVPGPGMLTVLAGLAILAREYDLAKDLHHWGKRQVDRLLKRFRARRQPSAAERRVGARD